MNANVVELDNHIINEETHIENIQEIKIESIECAFQKMTPIECDDISYYKQALDFVFKEDDLVNIAITGPYSSGKSSVINTYKKISKKNIIHISLAYFNEIISKELSEKEQNSLEGKIINQLIHQIDPKKIPLTRFKIKPDLEEKTAKKTTGLIISLISCLIFLMNFTWWKEIVNGINNYTLKSIFKFSSTNIFYILVLLGFIMILTYSINEVIKEQFKSPIFKKIKIKDNEIELFDKHENSIFNRYLDEILYILIKSDIDAIVFEDIDRYDDRKIFSKIREINFLVNTKLEKNKMDKIKKLRFVYLLRDDLFLSKDRTKFFDFILPIVPVVDSSNSHNKLIDFMTEGKIVDKFDNLFIERLCLYIDDMRLLKNIYNEFIVYSGRIKVEKNQLDNNKLLSIIVYKNIFPKDFSDLQLNSGYVYGVLLNKEKLIKSDLSQIQNKINENRAILEKIKSETLNSIDELDTIYSEINTNYRTFNGNYSYEFNCLLEFIKQVKKDNYEVIDNRGRRKNIKAEFEALDSNKEYIRRKNTIENKNENLRKKFEEEIIELNNEAEKINSLKICELIQNTNENEEVLFSVDLEESNKIQNSQYYYLIKYLIREGKIDESYNDYLTYFYENNLTKEDKIFLRSITDRDKKGYNYKLKNVSYLTTKLEMNDFIHKEILNIDLLDYMLKTGNEYIEEFLKNIYQNKKNDFIFEYINKGKNIEAFIRRLNTLYPDIVQRILSGGYLNHSDIIFYLIYTFEYLIQEEYKTMNVDNVITEYISSRNDILEVNGQTIDLQISAYKILNVKFEKIQYDKVNKDLFYSVYENNLYQINTKMIELILSNQYLFNNNIEYWKKNYTLISSNKNEPLKKYVEDNMKEYIELMLGNSSEGIYDEEGCIISLLNNEDIDIENKFKYINLLKVNISDISGVVDKDNLYEELLRSRIAEYNSNNILTYYSNYSKNIDTLLIDFIESNDHIISFNMDYNKFDKNRVISFFDAIIKNNNISISKYKMILEESDFYVDSFEYIDIQIPRVEYLIKSGILKMTEDNMIFIRDNYKDLTKVFIISNIIEYKKIINENLISDNEILMILDEEFIFDQDKIDILLKYSGHISLKNKSYSEKLQHHILKNNFDNKDLLDIISSYSKKNEDYKKIIFSLCIKNIDKLIDDNLSFEYDLLVDLLNDNLIEEVTKKKFLYNHMPVLSKDEIINCFKVANFSDYSSLFEGKRPKIKISEENDKLLSYLREKKWIGKYDIDSAENDYYRVVGIKCK